jgi:hypothetical protein
VRTALARDEQKKLAEIRQRANAVVIEAHSKRIALRPFDYSESKIADALLRQEMRTALRSMTPEERTAAMKKFDFKYAALETLPELSGLDPSVHELLTEAEIAEKFPDVVSGTAEALKAAELVNAAVKAADAAIANELLASGATVAEPVAPEAAKAWA